METLGELDGRLEVVEEWDLLAVMDLVLLVVMVATEYRIQLLELLFGTAEVWPGLAVMQGRLLALMGRVGIMGQRADLMA